MILNAKYPHHKKSHTSKKSKNMISIDLLKREFIRSEFAAEKYNLIGKMEKIHGLSLNRCEFIFNRIFIL